ncbi:MAG: sigma-54-dependent Fis family transcriptional regulator [Acidobacteria bacterium]|nr:sigma-54-dependent Fis family transcriptional regulator [Acidobacteriota bacterium]
MMAGFAARGMLDGAGADDLRVTIAVGRRELHAGQPGALPERARALGEIALVTGRALSGSWDGERWVVAPVDEPAPALVAARSARAAWRELRRAACDAAQRAAAETLPALLAEDPLLEPEASSPSLAAVCDVLRRVARTTLPVLVLGETGAGKEVVARALHRASARGGPFVAENCAALPEGLLEAELFGVRRGAFTGAAIDRPGRIVDADHGTLLLDEVGDLPPATQVKLLRVLQEREVRALGARRATAVDLRVVSATHHDLPRRTRAGYFRADLFYRLAGAVVDVPPLRRRPADLPYLVAALLARAAREGLAPRVRLRPAGLVVLRQRTLLGNVRELDNALRRAAALSDGAWIEPEHLADPAPLADADANLEVLAIREALDRAGGIKTDAARRLGWTRQKLYRRIEALGLDEPS